MKLRMFSPWSDPRRQRSGSWEDNGCPLMNDGHYRLADTRPPSTAATSTMARLVDLLGW